MVFIVLKKFVVFVAYNLSVLAPIISELKNPVVMHEMLFALMIISQVAMYTYVLLMHKNLLIIDDVVSLYLHHVRLKYDRFLIYILLEIMLIVIILHGFKIESVVMMLFWGLFHYLEYQGIYLVANYNKTFPFFVFFQFLIVVGAFCALTYTQIYIKNSLLITLGLSGGIIIAISYLHKKYNNYHLDNEVSYYK